jgi:hypothetical protein
MASEIAMWLFLLGPTKVKQREVGMRLHHPEIQAGSLDRQEILRCGKMPLF